MQCMPTAPEAYLAPGWPNLFGDGGPFPACSGERMQPPPRRLWHKISIGICRQKFPSHTAVARGQIGHAPALRQASACAMKSPAREEVRRASIMTGSLGGGALPVGPKRLGRRVNRFGSSEGNAATQQIQAPIIDVAYLERQIVDGRPNPAYRPSPPEPRGPPSAWRFPNWFVLRISVFEADGVWSEMRRQIHNPLPTVTRS
jgi:hypothetical protein